MLPCGFYPTGSRRRARSPDAATEIRAHRGESLHRKELLWKVRSTLVDVFTQAPSSSRWSGGPLCGHPSRCPWCLSPLLFLSVSTLLSGFPAWICRWHEGRVLGRFRTVVVGLLAQNVRLCLAGAFLPALAKKGSVLWV